MAEQTRYMVLGNTALDSASRPSSPAPDGGAAGLNMSEMQHLGKLIIRGNQDVLDSLCAAAGLTNPAEANTTCTHGQRHAVWLGPDEVMLLVEAGAEEQLAVSMQKSIENSSGSVVNVTDGLCALSLSGDKVRDVLAKGCQIDLHPKAFVPGDCAQTLLSHAGITLICLETNKFILIGRTSFTAYIAAWLTDAALEYGVNS